MNKLLLPICCYSAEEINGFTQYCNTETSIQICRGLNQSEYRGTFEEINKINSKVNNRIKFKDDEDLDVWTIPTDGYGDCEDYALSKANELLNLGWNSENLRIGILKYRNTFHAVLIVKIDAEMYFLDNNNNEVKRVNKIPGNGMRWYMIQIPGTNKFERFEG